LSIAVAADAVGKGLRKEKRKEFFEWDSAGEEERMDEPRRIKLKH
jgi:hypothetical protein